MEKIQSESLRIGNYVTINNPNHHAEIKDVVLSVTGISQNTWRGKSTHSISLEHIDQEENKYYESFAQFIKYIEPIPLTEEWLVKFGFQKARIDSRYYKLQYSERGTYLLNRPGSGYTEVCIEGTTTAQGPTESVHQLQNLYFALTGMELTIKE